MQPGTVVKGIVHPKMKTLSLSIHPSKVHISGSFQQNRFAPFPCTAKEGRDMFENNILYIFVCFCGVLIHERLIIQVPPGVH